MNQHDVKGHAQLQALMRAPLLVGENLTSLTLFRDFFEQRALRLAQPDVTRLGGITRWLDVASLARANNLRVVPACWDSMQVSIHLAAATPEVHLMEHLDWTLDIFEERLRHRGRLDPRAGWARRRLHGPGRRGGAVSGFVAGGGRGRHCHGLKRRFARGARFRRPRPGGLHGVHVRAPGSRDSRLPGRFLTWRARNLPRREPDGRFGAWGVRIRPYGPTESWYVHGVQMGPGRRSPTTYHPGTPTEREAATQLTTKAILWDFDGTLARRTGFWSDLLIQLLDADHRATGTQAAQFRDQMRTGFPWHDGSSRTPRR